MLWILFVQDPKGTPPPNIHRISIVFAGRKDLFTVLYEYMPADVLSKLIVIYDFGCNFREYTLNREPLLFRTTQVFID